MNNLPTLILICGAFVSACLGDLIESDTYKHTYEMSELTVTGSTTSTGAVSEL